MNRMLELDGVSVSAEQVGQHGGFCSHVMADLCMHGYDCHETATKKHTQRQQARSVWLR